MITTAAIARNILVTAVTIIASHTDIAYYVEHNA